MLTSLSPPLHPSPLSSALQHAPWLSTCAGQVEIDRDNRERERSEEARREKFQRDALKIRETLDDDRSKRIEVRES